METLINFGVFNVPNIDTSLTATFSGPANLAKDKVDKYIVPNDEGNSYDAISDNCTDDVTHESFFGENIRRIKSILGK